MHLLLDRSNIYDEGLVKVPLKVELIGTLISFDYF